MVATQLLESMIINPTPTRAEVVDVVNAILEGIDSLLLTGETAIGKYPIECVKWIRKIIARYENDVNVIRDLVFFKKLTIRERFAKGIIELTENIGTKIVVYTKTENAPRN